MKSWMRWTVADNQQPWRHAIVHGWPTNLNQVIAAENIAKANVIKRREETAATRSLRNTAKLMEDNPILLRLKELEALEKVSEKIGNVVGTGMDGVLDDLIRIRPRPADKP